MNSSIVKIGFTTKYDLMDRVIELGKQTASPGRFIVIRAVWVEDAHDFEQYLHGLFSEQRLPSKFENSKQPEFFDISNGSFEQKVLFSALSREVARGGIEYSKTHGKYSESDLFIAKSTLVVSAPESVASVMEDVLESVPSVTENVPEPVAENDFEEGESEEEVEVTEVYINDVLFYKSTDGKWFNSSLEPTNNPNEVDEVSIQISSMTDSLESCELTSSNDSAKANARTNPKVDANTEEDQEDKKRQMFNHEAAVENDDVIMTPVLCYSPAQKAIAGRETLQLKFTYKNGVYSEIGGQHAKFDSLSGIASEHATRLGWKTAAKVAKQTGVKSKFVHKPGGRMGNHGPTYTSYDWKDVFTFIRKGKEENIKEIVDSVCK
jgi:hypothetical protein